MKKLSLIILLLFSIFLSSAIADDVEVDSDFWENNATVGDSVSYSTIQTLLDFTDKFVGEILPIMIGDAQYLFVVLASCFLIFHLVRGYKGNYDLGGFMNMLILLGLISAIMYTNSSGFYFQYIYKPLFSVLINFPAYVVRLTASMSDNGAGSLNSIQGLFIDLDELTDSINRVADRMAGGTGSWLSDTASKITIGLKAGILFLIFFIMRVAFVTMYSVGIFCSFIMLVFLPFGVLLYPFPQSRGLFTNIMKTLTSYLLLPTVASIILGFVFFMTRDLVIDANRLLSDAEILGEKPSIDSFFGTATLIGIVSLVMLSKSYQFTNALTSGAISKTSSGAGGAVAGARVAGTGAGNLATGAKQGTVLGGRTLGGAIGGARKLLKK